MYSYHDRYEAETWSIDHKPNDPQKLLPFDEASDNSLSLYSLKILNFDYLRIDLDFDTSTTQNS